MTIYIGDVHGKFSQYKKIIRDLRDTVQVGDLGVGFINYNLQNMSNPPHYLMEEGRHRFIRGNHDNPSVCRKHSQCIPDGYIEKDTMFIGGGLSIDKYLRHEGLDWWADEELSTSELNILVDKYIDRKPKVMVTHDCPEEIAQVLEAMFHRTKLNIPSRTRQAFQSMWSSHSPELWVFGHWHNSFDQVCNGTRFVCLAELEVKEL